MSTKTDELKTLINDLITNLNEIRKLDGDLLSIQSSSQAGKLTVSTAPDKQKKDNVKAAFTRIGIEIENVPGKYYFRVNISDVQKVLVQRKMLGMNAFAIRDAKNLTKA